MHKSVRSIFLVLTLAATPAVADPVTLVLPEGDAERGREAFLALSCTSCHGVAGETEFPAPVSASRGPTLGGVQAAEPAARLGMSIFAPSHEITANIRNPREDGLSPMGDFSDTMTVRQFLDLIAYLRSSDGRGGGE